MAESEIRIEEPESRVQPSVERQQSSEAFDTPDTTTPTPDIIASAVQDVQNNDTKDDTENEESFEARIDRLGRIRPEKFKSIWTEIGFVFSITMSQVVTVSDRVTFIVPSNIIGILRVRIHCYPPNSI